MADCRISNNLANFLIELSLNPALFKEYQDNKEAVINRAAFGLSTSDKNALRSSDPEVIREALDNVQVFPPA